MYEYAKKDDCCDRIYYIRFLLCRLFKYICCRYQYDMRKNLALIIGILASIQWSAAQTWSFDLSFGAAANVPMPLSIHQQGYPDIKLNAHYYTEPFTAPVYWDWRFARWKDNRGWEFEAINHKLYLENKPDEVQQFSISHGLNLLYINRQYINNFCTFKIGAGIALTHPENRVRMMVNDQGKDPFGGYHVSGPAINLAAGRRFYLMRGFYVNVETKTTFCYARIPVALGHADVFSFAFHLSAGLGYDFIQRYTKLSCCSNPQ